MFTDPDRTVLHRAIRVAIVLPVLLWVGLHVLHDMQFALVASFGSFAALAMADFMGPPRSRLVSHAVLAMAGAALVVLGTALSHTLWPAVIAMLCVGVAAQFLMALGGQFALGNNAAVLAFVVAVMVPAGPEAIASRVAGWIVAMACAALAASLLWPRHERRDLYASVAAACTAIAALVSKVADGAETSRELAEMQAAVERVRDEPARARLSLDRAARAPARSSRAGRQPRAAVALRARDHAAGVRRNGARSCARRREHARFRGGRDGRLRGRSRAVSRGEPRSAGRGAPSFIANRSMPRRGGRSTQATVAPRWSRGSPACFRCACCPTSRCRWRSTPS